MADLQGGAQQVGGDTPHDDADSGNPVKIGHKAVEFNTDPPIVSADDDRVDSIATPQGIQYVLGGHPNLITREWMTTGAQTDDPIIDSIAAGSQIIITDINVGILASGSNTPQVRIGFGTASVPAEPTTGNSVVGMVLSHPALASTSGMVKGSGAGIVAMGGDGEELRITNDTPGTGQITVVVTYYISAL